MVAERCWIGLAAVDQRRGERSVESWVAPLSARNACGLERHLRRLEHRVVGTAGGRVRELRLQTELGGPKGFLRSLDQHDPVTMRLTVRPTIRVKTGRKEQAHTIEDIARVIAAMTSEEEMGR